MTVYRRYIVDRNEYEINELLWHVSCYLSNITHINIFSPTTLNKAGTKDYGTAIQRALKIFIIHRMVLKFDWLLIDLLI